MLAHSTTYAIRIVVFSQHAGELHTGVLQPQLLPHKVRRRQRLHALEQVTVHLQPLHDARGQLAETTVALRVLVGMPNGPPVGVLLRRHLQR